MKMKGLLFPPAAISDNFQEACVVTWGVEWCSDYGLLWPDHCCKSRKLWWNRSSGYGSSWPGNLGRAGVVTWGLNGVVARGYHGLDHLSCEPERLWTIC